MKFVADARVLLNCGRSLRAVVAVALAVCGASPFASAAVNVVTTNVDMGQMSGVQEWFTFDAIINNWNVGYSTGYNAGVNASGSGIGLNNFEPLNFGWAVSGGDPIIFRSGDTIDGSLTFSSEANLSSPAPEFGDHVYYGYQFTTQGSEGGSTYYGYVFITGEDPDTGYGPLFYLNSYGYEDVPDQGITLPVGAPIPEPGFYTVVFSLMAVGVIGCRKLRS
jgi:hypothetical protein